MCSTPRCSAKPRRTHQLSESASEHKSYSQMMRNASQRYEQRQEELAKRREEQAQKKSVEKDTDEILNLTQGSLKDFEFVPLKEPEVGFFMRKILRLFRFMDSKHSPTL